MAGGTLSARHESSCKRSRKSSERWGTPDYCDELLAEDAPSKLQDERFRRWYSMRLRLSASPADAAALQRMNADVDTRALLPSIRVPTLIVHRVGDQNVAVKNARYAAEHIPGARYIELPGLDHLPWIGDSASITRAFREFLEEVAVAAPDAAERDRVLSTVLFTDIVGSTARAAELGDRAWGDLLEQHHASIREQLASFRGREIDTAGDGFFASFDGPARAIRCAGSIQGAVAGLGLEIRAGIHTGECEIIDEKVGRHRSLDWSPGGRAGRAGRSPRLADGQGSRRRLGNRVSERGLSELKGVPGDWRLFAVESV